MPHITVVFGKIISDTKIFDERIPLNEFNRIKSLFDESPILKKCSSKKVRKYYSFDCIRIVEKGGIVIDQYKIIKQNIEFIPSQKFDKYILFEERSIKEIDSNAKERDLILEQEIDSYCLLENPRDEYPKDQNPKDQNSNEPCPKIQNSNEPSPNIHFDFIKENDYCKISIGFIGSFKSKYNMCVTMIENFLK